MVRCGGDGFVRGRPAAEVVFWEDGYVGALVGGGADVGFCAGVIVCEGQGLWDVFGACQSLG